MLTNLHNDIDVSSAIYPEFLTDQATIPAAHRTAEPRTFELPMAVWYCMFVSYAVFFGALLAVTGKDAGTVLVIVISMAYAAMYFGTASILNSISPKIKHDNNRSALDTNTGSISFAAAYAQILTVPILVAIFGCAVSLIYVIVTP